MAPFCLADRDGIFAADQEAGRLAAHDGQVRLGEDARQVVLCQRIDDTAGIEGMIGRGVGYWIPPAGQKPRWRSARLAWRIRAASRLPSEPRACQLMPRSRTTVARHLGDAHVQRDLDRRRDADLVIDRRGVAAHSPWRSRPPVRHRCGLDTKPVSSRPFDCGLHLHAAAGQQARDHRLGGLGAIGRRLHRQVVLRQDMAGGVHAPPPWCGPPQCRTRTAWRRWPAAPPPLSGRRRRYWRLSPSA